MEEVKQTNKQIAEALKRSTKKHKQTNSRMSSKTVFEQWQKHLDRSIASNGELFEGDRSLNM